MPRNWAEGFARLDLASPLPGFSPACWRQLIDDGGRFLDRWGLEAAALGWRAEDVFGVHPGAPATRYDAMGLVTLIRGGLVERITDCTASIQQVNGELLV